jgi:hypothetical protein
MPVENPVLGEPKFDGRQSLDRRQVYLSTGYRVEEMGVGPFVGGGEPAVGGPEDVPVMEGRRVRDWDVVGPAGREAVQCGSLGVSAMGGVEEEGALVRRGAEAEPSIGPSRAGRSRSGRRRPRLGGLGSPARSRY